MKVEGASFETGQLRYEDLGIIVKEIKRLAALICGGCAMSKVMVISGGSQR